MENYFTCLDDAIVMIKEYKRLLTESEKQVAELISMCEQYSEYCKDLKRVNNDYANALMAYSIVHGDELNIPTMCLVADSLLYMKVDRRHMGDFLNFKIEFTSLGGDDED